MTIPVNVLWKVAFNPLYLLIIKVCVWWAELVQNLLYVKKGKLQSQTCWQCPSKTFPSYSPLDSCFGWKKEKSLEAERRKHCRHCIRDDRIQIFSRKTQIIGKLQNISKTGLAFQYVPVQGEKIQTDTIDIMAAGPARFYLSGLACRRIYDICALDEEQTFTGTETRLCGLEFISNKNIHQLLFFLENYLNLPVEELHSSW